VAPPGTVGAICQMKGKDLVLDGPGPFQCTRAGLELAMNSSAYQGSLLVRT
jgi:hypothetical protein